jgi:hypothetical protein
MLWIFDEEYGHKSSLRMLGEGVSSLIRQHAKADDSHYEGEIRGIGYQVVSPGISPFRLIQAGFAASILLLAFVFALSRSSKLLPSLHSSREARSLPHKIQAPVRIEHLIQ